MIIRISEDAQYRLDDALRDRLDDLDNRVVATVDARDEDQYAAALQSLLAFVREHGDRLDDEELIASDAILPPADLSLSEAAAELNAEGLIPG